MNRMLLVVGLGALVITACSGDDEEAPAGCGDAAVCTDGGAGTSGGSGGTGGGGSGGTGGTGGMGTTGGMGGAGGTGGTGGSDPDDDGGVMPGDGDGDGDASVPTQPLPDDGNQASVCENGTDCNQGLDCYNAGAQGQGFCSATCEEDMDCESIAGATYRCSMSTGVCIVECEGEDDTESCPDQMVCVNTAGFGGGGGGGMASYRCKYPDAPPPEGTAQAFEACSMEEPCVDGLVCNGGGFGGSGYCTAECELPAGDCSSVADAAGDLTAECTMGFGGPGGGGARCTIDCSENEDGCPEGMTCISTGGGGPGGGMMRCGFE